MPLVVRNLTLRFHEPEENLRRQIARVLEIPPRAIRSFGVIRRSVDARNHEDIRRVYHVECSIDGDEQQLVKRGRPGQVALVVREKLPEIPTGSAGLPHRPVVVGSGPAGLFAALLLAERGYMPLLLERGQDVPARHKALHLYYTQGQFDPENNLLFGIGGAGTYSDGKLYSRTHDARNTYVLETLVRFGADPNILIEAKPHLGSDKLPGVCRRIVEAIRAAGGEVRYGARVSGVELSDNAAGTPQGKTLRAIVLEGGEKIPCSVALFAIGHSSRDTYRFLHSTGVTMAAKPFQMGVRIEHPQAMINRNQHGPLADTLPPADYTLVAKNAGATCSTLCGPDMFSFCMCPGGTILPSNESPREICTNGASSSQRDSSFANSGLVVTILPTAFADDPIQGIAFQQKWEQLAYQLSGSYAVPAQRAPDFLANRPSDGAMAVSYPLGAKSVDLRQMLPDPVLQALIRGLPMLDRLVEGFASPEGIITGPETRASSPVRITRDDVSRQSISVAGLYPAGEGAGYAGGIVSSATDGLKSAEVIVALYAPLKK
ncbi:MAG: NAD(P)/FAD-dependent oxidoreductase [Tepidisphaerales bacterium]